jgi:spore coat polysaccharide biosynthesis protein SpsF
MLAQQLRRLRRCREADEIVVATTVNAADDPVVALAEGEGVRWHRGSEHDVLGRYAAAAAESRADVVVRVTADCPLIDPEVTDRVIAELSGHAQECDYASNVLPRTFPRGLDTEALFHDVLVRVDRLARSAAAREHVTLFVAVERPELFARRNVADAEDHSDLRWTVDTAEDLAGVRAIYEGLGLSDRFLPYPEILAWVRARTSTAPTTGA